MQTVMELKRSLHSSYLDTRQGSQHPRRQPEPDYTAKVMQGSRINAFSRSIFCCTETFTRSWKEYPQGQTSFFFFFKKTSWQRYKRQFRMALYSSASCFMTSKSILLCLQSHLLEIFAGVWVPIWRRKWQPTPVFLPGESQGQRSLVGCRLWGRTESDTTEAT